MIVLRLKRTRNPDMVCMKLFEQFLHDMNDRGVIVLLCGVRADFAEAMANLHFQDLLPADRVLLEDKTAPGSSTVEAVRRALRTCRPSCLLEWPAPQRCRSEERAAVLYDLARRSSSPRTRETANAAENQPAIVPSLPVVGGAALRALFFRP